MCMAIASILQPLTGPIPQFLRERHRFRYWRSSYLPSYIYDAPPVIILFLILETLYSNISSTITGYTSMILHLYTFRQAFGLISSGLHAQFLNFFVQ